MRRPSPLPQPPVASRGPAAAGAPTPRAGHHEADHHEADHHQADNHPADVSPTDDYSIENRPGADHPTEDLSFLREGGLRPAAPAHEVKPGSPDSALTDGDDTAPVIPLSSPTALPDAAPGVDSEQAPGSADKTDAGDVGFREVWRASRARRKALRPDH